MGSCVPKKMLCGSQPREGQRMTAGRFTGEAPTGGSEAGSRLALSEGVSSELGPAGVQGLVMGEGRDGAVFHTAALGP